MWGGVSVRGGGGGSGWEDVRVDVNDELKLGSGWQGGGGQGRCEQRSEVFVKIHLFFFGGGVRSGGGVGGYQGRCNREVNFLRKFKK